MSKERDTEKCHVDDCGGLPVSIHRIDL